MALLILMTAAALSAMPPLQAVQQPAELAPPVPSVTPAPQDPVQVPPAPVPPADVGNPPQNVPPPDNVDSESDVIVTARSVSSAPDPLRGVNVQAFNATQAIDGAIIGPVAMVYKKKVPSPIRSGIHNFIYNLREPVVFINFVFQHKMGKAAETVGRFVLNSTIGAIGVFDMAKRRPFKLPRRGNGFADTLGFYGVPNGPFMYLPIVGPTTVRDLFGGTVDRLTMPLAFGKTFTRPSYTVPAAILGALDHRADFDETLTALHDGQEDPYANTRAFYLERRQAEIDHLRGRKTGASSPISEKPVGPIRINGRLLTPPADPVTPVQPTQPAQPTQPSATPRD